jgi:hypothetical protein
LHIGSELKRLHGRQLETIAEMLTEIDQQICGLIRAHAPLQKAVDA